MTTEKQPINEGDFVKIVVNNGTQTLTYSCKILKLFNDFIEIQDKYSSVFLVSKYAIVQIYQMPKFEKENFGGNK